MAPFEIPKVKYSGTVTEVTIGTGDKAITVGGESCYPFHLFEGEMPHKPVLAMEVWDMEPTEWPTACREPFKDVLADPAAWAKKCVNEYGADAIVVQLKSTDPNGEDAPPEKAAEVVGKVLEAVDVPVIVWGSANAAKDAEVLTYIAEKFEGKNLALGPVDEDNHKKVGAACLAYNHTVIASSPIDVNLAKQLNILLNNLGVPMERIIIDPTTGGLGYGLEYAYSVMERIRMAGLVQEDDKLQQPMINNLGNEVWKSKEAVIEGEDSAKMNLGDDMRRGVLMEITAAVAYLLAGSDILILRHPDTLKEIRAFIEKLSAERAPAAERVKVDRPKVAPIAGAKPKPKAAAPKPAAAAKPEPPKPEAKPAAPPKPEAEAKPEPKPEPAPKPEPKPEEAAAEAEAKAKAEEEARKRAEEEAKRRAEEEARRKAEEEARKKAEEEARRKAEEEARRKAREEAKAKQMEEVMELRRKRREEREKRLAQMAKKKTKKRKLPKGATFGEGRKPGVAGPNAIYIELQLSRWRMRGDGYLRRD